MKFISKYKILDIGCAALRCGRWYFNHLEDKEEDNPEYGGTKFALGYHLGKYYAYMYELVLLGLAEMVTPAQIEEYDTYLKDFHEGKIVLFKGKISVDFIISKKLFYQILSFPNDNYSQEIINDIVKWSPEIK